MVDGNLRHGLWFRQPQVDCDASPPLSVGLPRAPVGYASTGGAEMKFDRLATDVSFGLTGDMDTFAFEVISPEHAVAPTYGAIACGGPLGHPLEPPLNCAAVAGSLNHLNRRESKRISRSQIMGSFLANGRRNRDCSPVRRRLPHTRNAAHRHEWTHALR